MNHVNSNHERERLLTRIKKKKALIGIAGLGYVGLPLMLSFVESGFSVAGFDIDPEKVEKLNRGQTYIQHVGAQRVRSAWGTGKLHATTDFSQAAAVDAIILCVPTPLSRSREPDMSFVRGTIGSLLPYLRPGQLLSLESTTYPGTTEEEIKPRIESRGLNIGKDFFLVYSPEREDPGNKKFTTPTIPKVMGGVTPVCLEVGYALYSSVFNSVVKVSSTGAAEMTKLLENIYRAVNIALVNELKIVAGRMGIDIWEVIDAAATKPFGFVPFHPGPGWGGHCIPVDPFYLTWKARQYGVQTSFIELAGQVNTSMPEWVTGKMMDGLNQRKRALNGARVLVLGVAYKKNIDDVRESPAVKIMELLRQKKARIFYSDPHVPVFPKMREHTFDLQSMEINPGTLQNMDCILLATDHDAFDYDLILEHAPLIFDTRGRYRIKHEKIIPC